MDRATKMQIGLRLVVIGEVDELKQDQLHYFPTLNNDIIFHSYQTERAIQSDPQSEALYGRF